MSWISHHRFLVSGFGLAVILIVAAAGGVWFFLLRSTGTQIDLRQALRLYRHAQPTAAGPTNGLPVPGVYLYKTSGSERLSIAGIGRSFPSASDMIVTDAHCASMNWVPIDQHTEGIEICREPNGALTMSQASSTESIAGASTKQVILCPETAYFVPPNPHAGQRWSAVCHGQGQIDKITGEVIGATTISVGDQTVPALHTQINTAVSGNASGTDPTDYWVAPKTGLILRQREEVSVSQAVGPLGSVHYTEQMAITMSSLVPVR